MEPKKKIVALAGNPNSGKTTLFNELTGARQHVGNYPGVTVEKKQGIYINDGLKLKVVDLPGTYSLTAYSLEEVVARDFIVNEKPAMVVNIVDASNLERNLYLTVQFMEMGIPLCIALNMMDVAKARGIGIDAARLSELMGIPVIPTVARSGKGKDELMQTASQVDWTVKPLRLSYGDDLDSALDRIEALIVECGVFSGTHEPRWLALKCLENDGQILSLVKEKDPVLLKHIEHVTMDVNRHLKLTLDTYPEALIADYRYGFINSVLKQGVLTLETEEGRLYLSDKIDKVLVNRFAGPLIMVAVLLALYHFTFSLGRAPADWLGQFFTWLGNQTSAHMPDSLLKSLIVSGVIHGVGGVLGFVPLIMFMFFGISILEDSGYLARVAFMMDRIFRIFGLHGSSVMAYIVSGGIAGGCAVPGVMASRTLRSPKERLATLLTVPFMNCGAKLPVFALLIGAFFSKNEALMMLIITVVSWLGALIVAKVMRSTVIRGASTPFVMELPPYRMPTFKGLFIHTFEKVFQYMRKAGTVILGISVLLWAMMTFPGLPAKENTRFEKERERIMASSSMKTAPAAQTDEGKTVMPPDIKEQLNRLDAEKSESALRHSFAGRLGSTLENFTAIAGFDWRTNIALIGGFAAKEVIVSTLATAYSLGEADPEETGSLKDALKASPAFRPLVAFSLIIFTIFYTPCFVTVVSIVRESGSWKWGAFSMMTNTTVAFILAVTVFQTGRILGF